MSPRVRRTIGAAGLVLLVAIQQFGTIGESGLLMRSIANAGHVPLFAGVAAMIGLLMGWKRPMLVLAVCLAIAVGTELLQLLNDRSASVNDVARDMIGAGLVVVGVLLTKRISTGGSQTRTVWTLVVLVGVLLTIAGPAHIALAYVQRERIFPVIFEPGMTMLQRLWETNGSVSWLRPPAAPWHGSPDAVLELTWTDVEVPSLTVNEPIEDWSAFDVLVVETFVPGDVPVPLTVIVGFEHPPARSARGCRLLQGGFQRARYPLDELFGPFQRNPSGVRRLVLQTPRNDAGSRIVVGSIYLERQSDAASVAPLGQSTATGAETHLSAGTASASGCPTMDPHE